MREIFGKMIPEELSELIDPKHTAVLVIDIQNDYCSKGGHRDRLGLQLVVGRETLIRNIKSLIEEARRAKVLIVYTQQTDLPNHMSHSASMLYRLTKLVPSTRTPEEKFSQETKAIEGTWGWKIVNDVKPLEDDLVVRKHRASAFVGTDLDILLRANNIKTLAICGVVTQACVESTVRDAFHRDYFIVYLKDCVDSYDKDLHKGSLRYMEKLFGGVYTLNEVIRVWKQRQ